MPNLHIKKIGLFQTKNLQKFLEKLKVFFIINIPFPSQAMKNFSSNMGIENLHYLNKLKFYRSPGSSMRFEVIKTQVVDDVLYMLGRNGKDFVVFGFWLEVPDIKKCIPSDKYTYGTLRDGLELFNEITKDV